MGDIEHTWQHSLSRRKALAGLAGMVAGSPLLHAQLDPRPFTQHRRTPGMAEMMKNTPMYTSYIAVAPNPADFPKLLDRMGAWMRTPYNWAADVKTLQMPVMLVYGDSDMFRPEHIVKLYQLLGGGLKDAGWMRENMSKNRLAIMPDLTHYEMFAAPVMAQTVLPFLNRKSGAKSWAEQVQQAK